MSGFWGVAVFPMLGSLKFSSFAVRVLRSRNSKVLGFGV